MTLLERLRCAACAIALGWLSLPLTGCGRSERSSQDAPISGGRAGNAGTGGASGAAVSLGGAGPGAGAGADDGGAGGAPAMGDLTWALACQQPMVGLLLGEPGPPFTRTALGVSAPGECEMSTQPEGTTLIDFRETSERSQVTLLAEGWTIQSVTPEAGITVSSNVPNVADGFLNNTDYTLVFLDPPPATPIHMQYRSGSGQVTITLSRP